MHSPCRFSHAANLVCTLTPVRACLIAAELPIPYISTMHTESTTREMPAHIGLRAVFQPIVSVTHENVCGYEGLIRGIDAAGDIITPYTLFEQAARGGYIPDLDRRCREAIILAFASRFSHEDDTRLFLNVHPDVISDDFVPRHIYETVTTCGILPGNIIVEVDECRIERAEDLEVFADSCRKYGFKLALDDFGTFPCDPVRISFIQPEVLKIDISLVRKMTENEHASLAVKTLVQLAARTGSLVIAEGVETEQEALRVLEAGCRIIQGFYFSRPVEITSLPQPAIADRLHDLQDHIGKEKHPPAVPSRRRSGFSSFEDAVFPDYVILQP